MFYMLKRQPTLLRWELEAVKDDLFATAEATAYLSDVHRLTAQAEQLPANVAAERKAIVAAVDERVATVNATVADVRAGLREARGLAASVDAAGSSLRAMLKSADDVLVRYGEVSSGPSAVPARTFDVREYTEGVKALATALQDMNDVLKSSDTLLASPEWTRRIDDVNRAADARMKVAAEQGQAVVAAGFRQLWFTIGAVFGLLVLFQVTRHHFPRRAAAGAGGRGGAAAGSNGHATGAQRGGSAGASDVASDLSIH
jgi:hypothetical protein